MRKSVTAIIHKYANCGDQTFICLTTSALLPTLLKQRQFISLLFVPFTKEKHGEVTEVFTKLFRSLRV